MNTKQLLYSLSYPQILTALERKEIIATIKDQADTIADLKQELAKKNVIEIKLVPVKTLSEWFTNLPLIQKILLYNSFSEVLAKSMNFDKEEN
jgi:hypothetical protein